MKKNRSLVGMAPLFLVLLIDGMGLGLLFPILNNIIVDPSNPFISIAMSASVRDVLYGFIVGIYMICWFFGSAILGDFSDHIGRKRALMICLIGAFSGYFISAIAIIGKSLILLIFGRMVAGFTSGSQPIAQAAIVDVSSDEDKARNIGLILLSVSLGFVLGPIIGGVLSDNNLISWFTFSTPLYFASALSLLNAFLLWSLFHETFEVTGKYKLRLHHALIIFKSAFTNHAVRYLSVVLLIMIFGWSSYFTFISVYMLQKYHISALQNSLFLAVLGLGFSLGCGYLVSVLTKRFDLRKIVISTLFATALVVAVTTIFQQEIIAWVGAFLVGTTMSVAYSVLLTIFSDQVSAQEQGWVMGVTGSIMALCFGITSFFTGFMADFGASYPMYLSVLGLTISAILFVFALRDKIVVE